MEMLEDKKNVTPPFGVATKRFANIGFHPGLDVSGSMKRPITHAGPGTYDPEFAQCKSKRGVDWKLKTEVEMYSKYLGFRNAHILAEREYYKTLRGPGTTDVNEDNYRKQSSSILRNVSFGSGPRLKQPRPTILPPNVYFRKLEQTSTVIKRQFSSKPSFEWDGFLDRFRSRAPPYAKAPNRYKIYDGKNVDNILDKVVSQRGPYDLFTGPRDGSTIKNYFSAPTLVVPEYGYIQPSSLEILLRHPSKRRCGRFLKGARAPKKPTIKNMLNDISLCYKNPSEPGPANYDFAHTYCIQAKPETLHPFNKSTLNARPPVNWKISPGPGRYNPKQPKCIRTKRPSYVFLSKAQRKIFDIIDYTTF